MQSQSRTSAPSGCNIFVTQEGHPPSRDCAPSASCGGSTGHSCGFFREPIICGSLLFGSGCPCGSLSQRDLSPTASSSFLICLQRPPGGALSALHPHGAPSKVPKGAPGRSEQTALLCSPGNQAAHEGHLQTPPGLRLKPRDHTRGSSSMPGNLG